VYRKPVLDTGDEVVELHSDVAQALIMVAGRDFDRLFKRHWGLSRIVCWIFSV
jgi:hypothetical protein